MPADDATLPFPAFSAELASDAEPSREAITHACLLDEQVAVQALLPQAAAYSAQHADTTALARRLIETLRAERSHAAGIDALMHAFPLSSEEGVALMCLAEALLRIPDRETADRLIADRIGHGDWQHHLGASSSLFVNAAAWGLLLTGKLLHAPDEHTLGAALTRLLARGGEPLIRKGMDYAMRMLGRQFVAGRTIDEALHAGRERETRGYRHSYDMLGEAALTTADADAYHQAYVDALHAIGKAADGRGVRDAPGLSVKLSALHPRYARAQRERVLRELLPRLKQLMLLAQRYGIGINIDAEEAERLELSLELLECLLLDPELAGFDGIGFVVQAYQKRSPWVVDHLIELARRSEHRLMVRLVKGAYWDTEIKRAQVEGLPGYPVYTRKAHTDLCYLVCAERLLAAGDAVYPQLATHNALTMAAIHCRARALGVSDYEFQCLYGMGEALYDQVVGADRLGVPCRIYAPVGSHETLLPYLVRRLLENGANSSFVNQIVDPAIDLERLLQDPVMLAAQSDGAMHPAIPLPAQLYGDARRNSAGIDLSDEHALRTLATALRAFDGRQWHAMPAHVRDDASAPLVLRNPARHEDVVGTVRQAQPADVDHALAVTSAAAPAWQAMPAAQRAQLLLLAADLLQQEATELIALTMRDAGKTLPNAIGEVREATDFLRYYGTQIAMQERTVALGPVVCISPWNFPLAIFVGQIAAALAAGNTVLAKPAEQTPLTAFHAVGLLHRAGVPREVLQFVPGPGETVGAQLVADARTRGVVFTGSTEAARHIHQTLAHRMATERRDIPLIAETGGQNAMIVDSSALCEQVVRDAMVSAFDSAGQRCSALRVLCLQEEIAERTLTMLHGALRELRVGRPDRLNTDVGPVIDAQAQSMLHAHIDDARRAGRRIVQAEMDACTRHGSFVAPTVIEIDRMADLQHEVFGPVLHVLRYRRDELPQLIADINASGYGLTLGIHSRIDEAVRFISERARVGNVYVNRNMIGATVGVQPFGGEGLSGTGPKAGGPLYLKRLQQATHASPLLEALPVDAAMTQTIPSALAALLQWSETQIPTLAARCRDYQRANLYGRQQTLRGPAGESNVLRFGARGDVLCLASNSIALLNQIAAVLATGNRPVLLHASRTLLPADLPMQVSTALHWIARHQDYADLRCMLYEAGHADLLPEIAARNGAIVSCQQTDGDAAISLWMLTREQTICINTAAAGGNPALMTLQA